MFTGIVTAVGRVRSVERSGGGVALSIAVPWKRLGLGESVAVDGACLTVTARGRGWFEVRVVATSLDRTRFGGYEVGQAVNLERAVRAGDRLGGHLVQGHVDGLARVRSVTRRDDATVIDLDLPTEVARVTVPLGSITLDGVSLTVVQMPARNRVRVSLVPFTLQHTTLGNLTPGSEVHVEGDVIGKYVAQLFQPRLRRRTTRR
jgi:riboflavin synthase